MKMPPPAYRPLTDWERRLLLRLLGLAFPGRDVLLEQLENVLALPIADDNGTLKLLCQCPTKALVKNRIPTEGLAPDSDGMTIHYMLHVIDGKMCELEVYKDDSSQVVKHPAPESVEVVVLG